MTQIPTIKVHRVDLPDAPMEINEADFDPGVHVKWGEKGKKEEKKPETKDETKKPEEKKP